MSGSARSKVDLHLANAYELIRLAGIHGDHAALTSAVCLHFELAFGFYLIELLQTGRNSISPWPVGAESLSALVRQFDAPDLKELNDLAENDESWLYRMLRRLTVLRRCDINRSIKAEIFQSDLEEQGPSTRVIVSSRDEKSPGMDTTPIATDLKAFESLLSRQRLGHEEY
jgi:hypothetical protein